jgi:hypothetical protein
MAKWDDFLRAIREGAKGIAKDVFKDFEKEAVEDTKAFLKATEKDLKRWVKQLADKELKKMEFRDLVRGRADLAKLHALTQLGIALTKLERFRTKLLNLIIDTAFDVFLKV